MNSRAVMDSALQCQHRQASTYIGKRLCSNHTCIGRLHRCWYRSGSIATSRLRRFKEPPFKSKFAQRQRSDQCSAGSSPLARNVLATVAPISVRCSCKQLSSMSNGRAHVCVALDTICILFMMNVVCKVSIYDRTADTSCRSNISQLMHLRENRLRCNTETEIMNMWDHCCECQKYALVCVEAIFCEVLIHAWKYEHVTALSSRVWTWM